MSALAVKQIIEVYGKTCLDLDRGKPFAGLEWGQQQEGNDHISGKMKN